MISSFFGLVGSCFSVCFVGVFLASSSLNLKCWCKISACFVNIPYRFSIKNDDKLIQAEGVESLSEEELRQACRERGHLGLLSAEEMRQQVCCIMMCTWSSVVWPWVICLYLLVLVFVYTFMLSIHITVIWAISSCSTLQNTLIFLRQIFSTSPLLPTIYPSFNCNNTCIVNYFWCT